MIIELLKELVVMKVLRAASDACCVDYFACHRYPISIGSVLLTIAVDDSVSKMDGSGPLKTAASLLGASGVALGEQIRSYRRRDDNLNITCFPRANIIY